MQKKSSSTILILFLLLVTIFATVHPVEEIKANKATYVTDLWYPPFYGIPEKETREFTELVAKQLEDTGFFDITVKPFEGDAYTDLQRYGFYLSGWYCDYPDPSSYIDPFVGSETVFFGVNYSNVDMSSYIDTMLTDPDAIDRRTAVINAQKLIAKDVPLIPLVTFLQMVAAYSSEVKGVVLEPNEFLHYNSIEGDTVVIGTPDKIYNLDPANAYDLISCATLMQITHGLFELPIDSTDAEKGPILESFAVSPDAKTYSFNLKEGIKFSDGSDFNATVMAWNLNRSRFLNGYPGFLMADVINEVNVLDTHKLEIKLSVADATFLQRLVFTVAWTVSMASLPYDQLSGTPDQLPAGLGPYKVDSWTEDVECVLVPNTEYFGPAPKNNKVIIKFYPDASTTLAALQAGTIQVAHGIFGSEEITQIIQDPSLKSTTVPTSGVYFLVFNVDIHTDINVRCAIAAAINRSEICSTLTFFNNFNKPLFSMVPKIFTSHIDVFMDGSPTNPNVEGNMTLSGYTGRETTDGGQTPGFNLMQTFTAMVVTSTIFLWIKKTKTKNSES